ncbi:hypothetical protein [Schlesneria paludicola]|uniref:hypothetical protein n=1 Tax=Schlesneria paludicola TaxID=360056 RepID=UPI0002EA6F4A|nr:hypothetical protein [Schlesneria paludicola]
MMREFFTGWKRKVGILTLVMACVFAGGWVRSTLVGDFLTKSEMEVISISGVFIIRFAGSDAPVTMAYESAILDRAGSGLGYDDEWDSLQFGFGRRTFPVMRIVNGVRSESTTVDFRIPYWSIVVPLTLLSIWLLLSKPRSTA